MEGGLRAFRIKALHNPEMEPFEAISQREVAYLFDNFTKFLQTAVEINPAKLGLYIREIMVLRHVLGDNFITNMCEHCVYGMDFVNMLNIIAQLQQTSKDSFKPIGSKNIPNTEVDFLQWLTGVELQIV